MSPGGPGRLLRVDTEAWKTGIEDLDGHFSHLGQFPKRMAISSMLKKSARSLSYARDFLSGFPAAVLGKSTLLFVGDAASRVDEPGFQAQDLPKALYT